MFGHARPVTAFLTLGFGRPTECGAIRPVPSTYSIHLVSIELPAGLLDEDGVGLERSELRGDRRAARPAAIERPDGRVVDFLLDHGVVVYPVNPKALTQARDRFRQSGAKDDPFDARVLADFLRTDHARLCALQPSSEAAQELKVLTRTTIGRSGSRRAWSTS